MSNSNIPLRIDQPDGDTVYLPPWDYIVEHMKDLIIPITQKVENINDSLTTINNKLDEWLPDNT